MLKRVYLMSLADYTATLHYIILYNVNSNVFTTGLVMFYGQSDDARAMFDFRNTCVIYKDYYYEMKLTFTSKRQSELFLYSIQKNICYCIRSSTGKNMDKNIKDVQSASLR